MRGVTRPAGSRAVAGCLLVAAGLGGRPSLAESTEPIRLVVHASPSCVEIGVFAAEVTARTARARLAAPGELARTFTVTLAEEGPLVRGVLTIDDPAGIGGRREVTGSTCTEVASALALVTALAIDPKASTASRVRATVRPRAASEKLGPPAAYTALPWWGPMGAPLPVRLTPAAPAARWRITAALHATGQSGLSPHIAAGRVGPIDVARLGESMVAPSFRLSLLQADSGYVAAAGVPAGTAQARFRWTAVRVEGCPVRLALVHRLTLHPCALLDAGALFADGWAPFVPASQTRPWAAPGLLSRLQMALFEDLVLEAQGGVAFPLVRDTFVFDPSVTAFGVPVASWFFGGGVGMHFP